MNFWMFRLLFVCVLLLMMFIIGIGSCIVFELLKQWYSGRLVFLVVVFVMVIDMVSIVFVLRCDLLLVLFSLSSVLLRNVCFDVLRFMMVLEILVLMCLIVFSMFLLLQWLVLLLCSLIVLCELVDVFDGIVVWFIVFDLSSMLYLMVGLLCEFRILWLMIFMIVFMGFF